MLIKRIFAVFIALTAVAAIVFAAPAGSKTTLTLHDGRDVTLHPDSTWEFTSPGVVTGALRDDVYITLSDNRIVWLKTDFTWTFTKQQPRPNRPTEYQALNITGISTQRDLNSALNAAKEDAFAKSVATLRRSAPAHKNVQAFLMACLKEQIKEHEIITTHTQAANNQWKVEAKIELPSQRVILVMDCLHLQLE